MLKPQKLRDEKQVLNISNPNHILVVDILGYCYVKSAPFHHYTNAIILWTQPTVCFRSISLFCQLRYFMLQSVFYICSRFGIRKPYQPYVYVSLISYYLVNLPDNIFMFQFFQQADFSQCRTGYTLKLHTLLIN